MQALCSFLFATSSFVISYTCVRLPSHFTPFKYHSKFFCLTVTVGMPFSRSLVVLVKYPALDCLNGLRCIKAFAASRVIFLMNPSPRLGCIQLFCFLCLTSHSRSRTLDYPPSL